jgi:hypothetical protein
VEVRPVARPETIRSQAYQTLFTTREGAEILKDLVIFAQDPSVSEARLLGRADVIVRIERQRQKSKEPKQQETEDE